jgi:transposase InsO family protein
MHDIELTHKRTGWKYRIILSLYNVSKSELNRWGKEADKPITVRLVIKNPCTLLNEEIKAVIAYRTANDENRALWYKKLTWKMNDEDIVYISESSVYRILLKNKLLGRVFKENDGASDEFANKPTHIHQHWHIDIAYVIIRGMHYYLIIIIDGYSRYLLSWQLMTDMTGISVDLFVQKTLEQHPGTTPMVIHDNGVQFISRDFKLLLKNHGCIDVPTKVKHPETNGKAERMIGLIRQEALRPNSPAYFTEAEKVIDVYVNQYNNERLHAGIKFLKPFDVFIGRDNDILAARERKLQKAKEKRIAVNKELNKSLRKAVPT